MKKTCCLRIPAVKKPRNSWSYTKELKKKRQFGKTISLLPYLRCIKMETAKDHILIPISHFLCKFQFWAWTQKILCSFTTSSKKIGKILQMNLHITNRSANILVTLKSTLQLTSTPANFIVSQTYEAFVFLFPLLNAVQVETKNHRVAAHYYTLLHQNLFH